MFNQTLFDLIIGPVMSKAAISALGATETSFINNFNTASEAHWTAYGYGETPGDWSSVNYYDRAYMYYAYYAMSGYTNTTYRDRARQIAVWYRDQASANGTDFGLRADSQMCTGLALHYADTGDTTSLSFLGFYGDYWSYSDWLPRIGRTANTITGYDGRNTARGLQALVLASITGAPSVGHPSYFNPGNDFAANARIALSQIFVGQDADGVWRYQNYSDGLGGPFIYGSGSMNKPFMTGMIIDSLIQYYKAFEADSRIPTAVQRCCEYTFTGISSTLATANGGLSPATFWQPSSKCFVYIEGPSPDEPVTTPGGGLGTDLNGMIINGYAFSYETTGLSVWRTRTQLILEGLLSTYLGTSATKPLNQAYTTSYKTFPMLSGTAASQTLAATDAGDIALLTGSTGTKIRLNWV